MAKGIYKRQEAKAKAKKAPALLSSLNTVPVGGTSSQPPAYVKPLMEPGSLGFGRIETIAGAVRLVGYGASGSKP